MDNSLDLSRWQEAPGGVTYRRWVIVSTGLRQLFRLKFFKILLTAAWIGGAMIAVAGFAFSQSVASGGWLETAATKLGPRPEAMFQVISGLMAMYPDVIIHTFFTGVFWLHSFLGFWLSFLALTTLVPQLITRDRASNALLVYLSRPLTTVDYLLGKLGIIVGVLALVWTGPLLFGWLLSMLFATDRDFIIYSLSPLVRALAFNGIALVVLAAIALGVSALGRKSVITTIVWLGLAGVLGFMAFPPKSPVWVKRMSYTSNLDQVRYEIFDLGSALSDAAESLPLLDQRFASNVGSASRWANSMSSDFNGAMAALGFFVVGSSFVFFRKLRPE